MLLRGRGFGADNGLTVGDSFSIDYGGGDLTGADLASAEEFNSTLPAGASDSSGSSGSSSSGINWGAAINSVTSLFGAGARVLGGGGTSLTPSQLAMIQAQQNASQTNTLLIGGGLLIAGGLAFVLLRRKKAE